MLMEQSLLFVESVERMKKKLFSQSADLFALFPVSAYDTAWMAIVPNPNDPTQPMFPECLDWILRNQNALGFWAHDHQELINYKHQWSRADLMATLTCLIALKTWEFTGFSHKINKGLKFLRDNMEKELIKMKKSKEGGDKADLRRWFLMVELAKAKGLKVINNENFDKFKLNETMLKREEGEMMERFVMREMSFESGGSELFRSPSVTACAFMVTGDEAFKTYLQHLITNCQHGVPPIYLTDKGIIKLCVIDHLERLGCAEHFTEEIGEVMDHQYRKWILEESEVPKKDDVAFQLYKDSLAFRLLRMHGYQISPRRFCWFIDDEEMISYMKDNYALFLGPMLNIFKASHIAFLEDHELDKAGLFSKYILQKEIVRMKSHSETNTSVTSTKFEQEIEHELELKWLARMDHLEHKMYIERGGIYHFWIAKNAPHRILQNDDILQLAIDNFTTRQLVYRKELNELHRWSKDTGLSTMGFGREKTSYCYFAIASSTCLSLDTDSRKEAVKCAILITIADDFFDEKGSLDELSILTNAVQRWQGKCLTSHNKVIFTAVKNLVHDIALKSFNRHGHDVKKILQNSWREIFKSWLKEAEWSKNSHYPSIDQYIEIARISIAVKMLIITTWYLINSKKTLEEYCLDISNTMITKSLMILCRLLNDLESYEKEAKVGKPNIVLLYLKANPKAKIEDAIAFVRYILEKEKKEFFELVYRPSARFDMPRELKVLHLSNLKVFQMFFNSSNAFDSPTVLLKSINKAIYEPLMVKETRSQPTYFINKELKIRETKAPYKKVKISRTINKSALLSFDLNIWMDSWIDNNLHKPSLACNFFMEVNTISYKSML